MGLYHLNKGNYIPAEQMFEVYKNRKPNDPEVYQNLATVAKKSDRPRDAESNYLKVIELDPSYALAYFDLSDLYIHEKAYEKAEQRYKEFSVLKPEDPLKYYYLVLKNNQSTTLAIHNLEEAFKKGFKDLDRLKAEPLLLSLQNSQDYKKLVKKYFPDKT